MRCAALVALDSGTVVVELAGSTLEQTSAQACLWLRDHRLEWWRLLATWTLRKLEGRMEAEA